MRNTAVTQSDLGPAQLRVISSRAFAGREYASMRHVYDCAQRVICGSPTEHDLEVCTEFWTHNVMKPAREFHDTALELLTQALEEANWQMIDDASTIAEMDDDRQPMMQSAAVVARRLEKENAELRRRLDDLMGAPTA